MQYCSSWPTTQFESNLPTRRSMTLQPWPSRLRKGWKCFQHWTCSVQLYSCKSVWKVFSHLGFCHTSQTPSTEKTEKGEIRNQLSKGKRMTLKTTSCLVGCVKCKFIQHCSWKNWTSWQHWRPEVVHTKVPRDKERHDPSAERLPQSPTILNTKKTWSSSQTCQPIN